MARNCSSFSPIENSQSFLPSEWREKYSYDYAKVANTEPCPLCLEFAQTKGWPTDANPFSVIGCLEKGVFTGNVYLVSTGKISDYVDGIVTLIDSEVR
jgi:hypothetical protein